MKLDLACGNMKTEGFLGVDITKERTQADIVQDLEKFPWQFEDNSIDEIICNHYIEHTSDLIKFMNELYRIMKNGGRVTFVAPYYSSVRAWCDPTHKRTISENTFFYFEKVWRKKNRLEHYPIKANFKIVSFDYHTNPDFQHITGEDLIYASRHFWNVYDDIRTVLEKV